MEEARNPKPAEDVAGDTETGNASRRVNSESAQIRDANSSESFAENVTNSVSPNKIDSTDIERGAHSDETHDADDPL